jgi:hypothetical protein
MFRFIVKTLAKIKENKSDIKDNNIKEFADKLKGSDSK